MSKKCPKCDEVLNDHARACACGWKESKVKHQSRQCNYSDNGVRCPLIATIDETTCRFHFGWWDNPKLAALNLQDILKGNVKRGDWRDEVIEDFQSRRPEFAVVPDGREEIESMLQMSIAFIQKSNLPYNKREKVNETTNDN